MTRRARVKHQLCASYELSNHAGTCGNIQPGSPRNQKIRNQEIVRWVRFKVETFRIFILPEFIHQSPNGQHDHTPQCPCIPCPPCQAASLRTTHSARLSSDVTSSRKPSSRVFTVPSSGQASLITFFPSPPYFLREGNISYLSS